MRESGRLEGNIKKLQKNKGKLRKNYEKIQKLNGIGRNY